MRVGILAALIAAMLLGRAVTSHLEHGPVSLAAQEPRPKKVLGESLNGPPIVSAPAWAVADGESGRLLWSHDAEAPRQMASTTKIMTAWIALEIVREHPELLERRVTVSRAADRTTGSTSGIREGETLTIQDLMHALLLPSGNDAAIQVAEVFGEVLGLDGDQDAVSRFVSEMNTRADEMGLEETKYLDPHGNSANVSSARDLVRLAIVARGNERLRKIVATPSYRCRLEGPDGAQREVVWRNTNRLLEIEGYDGIKTGTTAGAGACLVSSGERDGQRLIVVVLGSTSRDGRYVDSRNLYRFAWRELLSK
ncbi:MAG: D-alanyl-D-alanine carboxypeptidase family protein [Planctomycetota bacterium]